MKFWSLQALRFWAALGVCVYDACQWAKDAGFHAVLSERLANAGQYGVDVFSSCPALSLPRPQLVSRLAHSLSNGPPGYCLFGI
jgi:hypothetical protein